MAMIELYQKINEAEIEARTNQERRSHKDVMSALRSRINEKI